jgi:hypothetical protein
MICLLPRKEIKLVLCLLQQAAAGFLKGKGIKD